MVKAPGFFKKKVIKIKDIQDLIYQSKNDQYTLMDYLHDYIHAATHCAAKNLRDFPQEILNNRTFAIAVMKVNGMLLKYFPDEIKQDQDVVTYALTNTLRHKYSNSERHGTLADADLSLRANETFILKILRLKDDGPYGKLQQKQILKFLAEDLKQKPEIFSACIKHHGSNYKSLKDDSLKSRKSLILLACTSDASIIHSLPKKFKITHEFALELVRVNAYALAYLPAQFRSKEVINAAFSNLKTGKYQAIPGHNDIHPLLKSLAETEQNPTMARLSVKKQPWSFRLITGEIKAKNPELVQEAIKLEPTNLLYAPENYKSSPDIVLSALCNKYDEWSRTPNGDNRFLKYDELCNLFTSASEKLKTGEFAIQILNRSPELFNIMFRRFPNKIRGYGELTPEIERYIAYIALKNSMSWKYINLTLILKSTYLQKQIVDNLNNSRGESIGALLECIQKEPEIMFLILKQVSTETLNFITSNFKFFNYNYKQKTAVLLVARELSNQKHSLEATIDKQLSTGSIDFRSSLFTEYANLKKILRLSLQILVKHEHNMYDKELEKEGPHLTKTRKREKKRNMENNYGIYITLLPEIINYLPPEFFLKPKFLAQALKRINNFHQFQTIHQKLEKLIPLLEELKIVNDQTLKWYKGLASFLPLTHREKLNITLASKTFSKTFDQYFSQEEKNDQLKRLIEITNKPEHDIFDISSLKLTPDIRKILQEIDSSNTFSSQDSSIWKKLQNQTYQKTSKPSSNQPNSSNSSNSSQSRLCLLRSSSSEDHMYLDPSLFGDLKTYQSNFYNLSVKPSSYLDSPEFKCSVISSIGISLQPDFQNSSILYSSRSTLEDKNSSHLSLKELLCRLPQNLKDILERKFNRFKTSRNFPANQAEINSKSTRGVKILMSQVFLDISSQNLISEYLGIKYDQETRPNKLKDFLCLKPEELSAQNNQIQRVLQHLSSMNFFNLTNLLNEEFKKYTSLHKLELTDEENTKLKKKIKELETDLSCSSLTSSSSYHTRTSQSGMQTSQRSNTLSSMASYESYSSSSSSCSADPTPSLVSSSSYHTRTSQSGMQTSHRSNTVSSMASYESYSSSSSSCSSDPTPPFVSSSSYHTGTSQSRIQISSSSNAISSMVPCESNSSSSSSCSADPTPSLTSSSSYHTGTSQSHMQISSSSSSSCSADPTPSLTSSSSYHTGTSQSRIETSSSLPSSITSSKSITSASSTSPDENSSNKKPRTSYYDYNVGKGS